MNRILLCWLGRTDLRAVTEADEVGIGPIAQALATGRFARLELLCDIIDAEDARDALLPSLGAAPDAGPALSQEKSAAGATRLGMIRHAAPGPVTIAGLLTPAAVSTRL